MCCLYIYGATIDTSYFRRIFSIMVNYSFMFELRYYPGMFTLLHPFPCACWPLQQGAVIPTLRLAIWQLTFLFVLFADFRLFIPPPWFIHNVSLLRRLVILGIPYSFHLSVINMIGSPWRPNFAAGSSLLWPPRHPVLGTSSVPSSVSIASLWSVTLCIGIIFHRCLVVPPVVYTSSLLPSGVQANIVIL